MVHHQVFAIPELRGFLHLCPSSLRRTQKHTHTFSSDPPFGVPRERSGSPFSFCRQASLLLLTVPTWTCPPMSPCWPRSTASLLLARRPRILTSTDDASRPRGAPMSNGCNRARRASC